MLLEERLRRRVNVCECMWESVRVYMSKRLDASSVSNVPDYFIQRVAIRHNPQVSNDKKWNSIAPEFLNRAGGFSFPFELESM